MTGEVSEDGVANDSRLDGQQLHRVAVSLQVEAGRTGRRRHPPVPGPPQRRHHRVTYTQTPTINVTKTLPQSPRRRTAGTTTTRRLRHSPTASPETKLQLRHCPRHRWVDDQPVSRSSATDNQSAEQGSISLGPAARTAPSPPSCTRIPERSAVPARRPVHLWRTFHYVDQPAALGTTRAWQYFDFDGSVHARQRDPVLHRCGDHEHCQRWSVRRCYISASPTHAGIACRFSRSWTVLTTTDLIFGVYTRSSNEATSTALAAQDTAASGDVTAADGIGQVRVRLQSTTAATVPALMTGSCSGRRTPRVRGRALGEASSPTATPKPTTTPPSCCPTPERSGGQSFLGNGGKLQRVRVWSYKAGTGGADNLTASLYAHTGTFGSGPGTGEPLTTSTPIAGSSVIGTTADESLERVRLRRNPHADSRHSLRHRSWTKRSNGRFQLHGCGE